MQARLETGAIDDESALRHVFHLLQIVPGALAEVLTVDVGEDVFEEWLDSGAHMDAAHALVADHFPLKLSEPNGHAIVTIEAPWFDASGKASNDTSAKSILIAWLNCLIDLQSKATHEFLINPDPVLRGPRSEQHRPSTRH
ncbi:hypothetical protein Q9K02_11620 [Qipengyuania sp. G39]|uniref:Uncharacterized protein n=1 Tax=Qipengyuania profundimaris TaxID=3067652 RepID=A0ABT9HRN2_9SPHN|nr:hypothetical protein [Qipengyuania sp. G39]MDP4575790.1 hypothetical protein [Qipengyuania sp. G39]